MFDTKILLVFLVIALVVLGAKRLRTLGSDLGASLRSFKQAVADDQPEEDPNSRGSPTAAQGSAAIEPTHLQPGAAPCPRDSGELSRQPCQRRDDIDPA
jgi:sec-independent protein translocase protein TatA